jgi:hydrogenase maturation factor HypF (carbamoyltransferase family)
MSIHLPTNLHEKMEFTISQYIGELHDLGVIEEAKEEYQLPLLRFLNKTFDLYLIDVLFDDTRPKYNKTKLFNQISNNYFNEEDKNELKKYYIDYFTNIRWNKKRRDKWLEHKHSYIIMLAHMFSKTSTNQKFVMDQIECVSNVILK